MRAKRWQMNKKDRIKLKKLLDKHLNLLGAVRFDHYIYEHVLTTQVDKLLITFDPTCGTIFTKFLDPDWAKTKVDCNPFSGKWNFHPGKISAETAFKYFRSQLSIVL